MITNRISFYPRNEYDRRLVHDRAEVVFVGCVWVVLFVCMFAFGHRDEARMAKEPMGQSLISIANRNSPASSVLGHSAHYVKPVPEVKNEK